MTNFPNSRTVSQDIVLYFVPLKSKYSYLTYRSMRECVVIPTDDIRSHEKIDFIKVCDKHSAWN